MPRKIMNAKIACLDFNLQKTRMHLGISIVVEDPTKLEAIRREYLWNFLIGIFFFRELDITKRRIEKIIKAGANVILTTGGIDDMVMKQFIECNAMAVRRCKKTDLKRIAKATGGIIFLYWQFFSKSFYI